MRPSALILVLFLGAVAFPRDGLAEKVKANQDTQLFARPGERAKVILKVTEGKQMTVLAKEGRWLKVRVMGRTGYVARSTVDMPDGDEVARNTRRRSFVDGRGTKRGFGGQEAPDDRIGADAVGEGQDEEKATPPKKGGGDDDEDEDDEEDTKPVAKNTKKEPPPKKEPPKKEPPKKEPPKKEPPKKGGDDDEDEEDDENPVAAKSGSKPAPKQVATAKKGGDDEDEDEDEGDSRKRVKLARKTSMYNDADTKSEVILVATADTALFPTGEKKGKFTEVENDEGDLGYILTADISGGEIKVTKKDEPEDEDDEAPSPRGKSQIDLRARAGVKLVSQALRSPGGAAMPPDNYNLSTSAALISLGGGYYRPMGKKLLVGTELTYEYASAFGGIPVQMGAMKATTTIAMHNLNLRGILGLDFHKPSGLMLLGRVGFQYYSYQVANASSIDKNLGKFPSEIIQSPTVGAALAMPSLTNKIGLRFSVDFIPLNFSYKQTKFLEDGKSPSAKGAIVGAGLTYRFKPSFDIQAGYDLTYTSATFGAKLDTSMRGHPMGGVKRTDLFHSVSVGIVKAF